MTEALIIVDFQQDFTPPDGALAVPHGNEIAERLNQLAHDQRYALVIATRDWHPAIHRSFRENGGSWPTHCLAGSKGAQLHPALDLGSVDAIIDKGQQGDTDGYSGFENEQLERLLRDHAVTSVTVVGLATDYCVLNTARDALRAGFAVTIDTSATRAVDVTTGDGDRALAALRSLGACVTDLALGRDPG